MAEIGVLSKANVNRNNYCGRIDADFFTSNNLSYDNVLMSLPHMRIGSFSDVTDGIHASIDFDIHSTINLLSAKSPKENFFDLSGNGYISARQHKENPRTALRENDIMLSTVGTIGNCAVVDSDILPANCDRHIGIIRIKKFFKPRFVSTFLLSKYGRYQTKRYITGNVQPNLFIENIRLFIVPQLSSLFQTNIENFVLTAQRIRKQSKYLYTATEKHLLDAIGLSNFTPSKSKVSIRGLADSFRMSNRIDAEYYQPKYDELLEVLQNIKTKKLDDYISNYSTGFAYSSKDYKSGEEYALVRINNIVNARLDISSATTLSRKIALQSPKDVVMKGDVLISMSGTIGDSCCVSEDVTAVINQRILRVTPNNIDGNLLSLILNSIVGRLQFERVGTGGVQTNISYFDMKKILIPVLGNHAQLNILIDLQKSFALRRQSEHLLETAKRAVEMAIEDGEDAAMSWLKTVKGASVL